MGPAPALDQGWCRAVHKTRIPDIAELRHATPVRTCTSLTVRPQLLQRFTRMLSPQQRSTSQADESSSARPQRICLLNSSALRAKPVNLPSFLQRKTRQTIYIIVIDISSFRSVSNYRDSCPRSGHKIRVKIKSGKRFAEL